MTALIAPALVTAVYTIGHSTRPLEEFLGLLAAYGIQAIADVRRFPGSRRHPHFGREALQDSLAGRGVGYLWLPQLGGRRTPRPDSVNTGWRSASFRGYADHLGSPEFAEGFGLLLELAARRHTAIMCSEVLWWRCHRALISDVLVVRGVPVLHILDAKPPTTHALRPPARVVEGQLGYPAEQTGSDPDQ